jgi:hypothetical protein
MAGYMKRDSRRPLRRAPLPPERRVNENVRINPPSARKMHSRNVADSFSVPVSDELSKKRECVGASGRAGLKENAVWPLHANLA